ncbi:MAG: GGDEF domain-containing protein [Tenericutes bacterium]|nr:GGDEF domain-containing protein [Mycoplasmatota bacterium]
MKSRLDWYLVITKDTNILAHFFLDYLYFTIIMVIAVVSTVAYITHLTIKKYQNKIYSLAKTDYLTLLLNRRGFTQEVEEFDSNIKEALIFIIDIDNFKLVNDKYGHSEGDFVLQHLAKLINKEASKYGKLSRWGGDEFTGFMIGQKSVLESVIENILSNVKDDSYLQEKRVTISLGYTYTDFSNTLDEILVESDKSLYEAKKQEGNSAIKYNKDNK